MCAHNNLCPVIARLQSLLRFAREWCNLQTQEEEDAILPQLKKGTKAWFVGLEGTHQFNTLRISNNYALV